MLERGASLFAAGVDELFSIRFQAVFLPLDEANGNGNGSGTGAGGAGAGAGGGRGGEALPPPKTEFCTEVYSYQTRDDADPRNLLILGTPQGTSTQQDTAGRGRLYFHTKDPACSKVARYWLEAEQSTSKVGGEQKESAEEAVVAAARGKDIATRIGPGAMGERFNAQLMIQVPLQQKPRRQRTSEPQAKSGSPWYKLGMGKSSAKSEKKVAMAGCDAPILCCGAAPTQSAPATRRCRHGPAGPSPPPIGQSHAAHVSRGSFVDYFSGLRNTAPRRDAS